MLGFRLSSFLDSYCSGYARLSLHMQPSLFILCIQFSILLGVESLRQEMNYIIIKKKSCDHCNMIAFPSDIYKLFWLRSPFSVRPPPLSHFKLYIKVTEKRVQTPTLQNIIIIRLPPGENSWSAQNNGGLKRCKFLSQISFNLSIKAVECNYFRIQMDLNTFNIIRGWSPLTGQAPVKAKLSL